MAGAAVAEPADRDNVVMVLDGSGSMADRMGRAVKMDAAKEAIREVLRTVPATTQIGLLVFTSDRAHRGWVYPLGPRDDAALLAALGPVEPGGGTPLGEYIKIAADRLLEERAAQLGYGTYRLLAVTDGQASDPENVARYTPEVMARGIVMDVIGVAMPGDHMLATQVHSYRRADDPAALTAALREVFGEVTAGGADAAAGDAFALIAGLPDGVAEAALGALQRGRNQPIGEEAAYSAPREAAVSPPHATSAPSPQTPLPAQRRALRFADLVVLVVVVVVGFKVVKRVFGG
jgi:hypothetical protein